MVGFLGIVLFFTYLNLVLCNSCDPNHGTEGMYDCVRIPSYNGYQWAVCLSSQSLRIHTSGHMSCQGSNFCWLPCTQSIYPKSKSGHIPKECKCDPVENERRKRSLKANGRESKVKVSSKCYVPAFKSNCQWYSTCLETHSSCEATDFQYAISYGKAICSIFLEDYNSFSKDGKSWIRSSQKCIEDRMRSLLMPNNTVECRNIRDRAYHVHSDCYFRNSNPRFCNLSGTDQQKIYWSIKQVYEHAFSEKFDEGMAKFRSCLRNNVYGHQRKFMFYVEKDSDQNIDENEFAKALVKKFEFSSHGVDWDVDKTTYSRKKRELNEGKRYQIVGIFVSRKQVDLVERSRSPNQPHLRKISDNEYDTNFLESFNKTITDGIKNNALDILKIKTSDRVLRTVVLKYWRIVGVVGVTGGITSIITCFAIPFACVSLVNAWYNERLLPDTPEHINTKFYLYSKNKMEEMQLILSNAASFSDFHPSKKTFIIVHGFLSNGDVFWISDMRDKIMSKVDANVIVVDWKKGADYLLHYEQAAVNTEVVGTLIDRLVRDLEDHRSAKKSHIHIIGHSLGAHVAGFAGSAHKDTRYQRITGLDPAGPYFTGKGKDARLDETDAHFVDVIHTNGGYDLLVPDLGYLEAMGHSDFYPNGGQFQPGCFNVIPLSENTCCHSRAYLLFTESIISDQKFKAWECESLDQCITGEGIDTTLPPDNRMGFYTDDSKKYKMYYLETNDKSPYDKPNDKSP